jgi:hypothetical protein
MAVHFDIRKPVSFIHDVSVGNIDHFLLVLENDRILLVADKVFFGLYQHQCVIGHILSLPEQLSLER